jgi:phospholipid/cholesterol/gamma-HCH transport system substrate-binding protein
MRTTTKGLVVAALLAAFVYLGVSSYNGVPFEHYRSLTAIVPDVGNLIQHDPVRIAGVRVGQVRGETVTPSGQAKVALQIDPGTAIPAGTQVMVRADGLLGARYIQLIPGAGRRQLPSGATLYGAPNALTFGVPETLATFDAPTRQSLGEMIDGLGVGLLGHGGQLNTGIHEVAPASVSFTELMQSILARPGAAARLIPSLESTIVPLNASRAQITAMLGPASQALTPFVTQRSALRQALTDAPSALSSAQAGLGSGEELLASASALASAAQRTLPIVPRGLKQATVLLRTAPTPLDRADALLQQVQPAVPAALKITSGLEPSLRPLTQGLQSLDPMLQYIGPRACDIENFGVTMRSMTGFGGVGNGPIGPPMEFRAQVLPGPEALAPIGALNPLRHDAYAAPCKYVDRPASVNPPLYLSGGNG